MILNVTVVQIKPALPTLRVDILSFTETEQEHYIKQALPDQPQKIKKLTQYLHQQSFIDSIRFIPFNMVILLYLYVQTGNFSS